MPQEHFANYILCLLNDYKYAIFGPKVGITVAVWTNFYIDKFVCVCVYVLKSLPHGKVSPRPIWGQSTRRVWIISVLVKIINNSGAGNLCPDPFAVATPTEHATAAIKKLLNLIKPRRLV